MLIKTRANPVKRFKYLLLDETKFLNLLVVVRLNMKMHTKIPIIGIRTTIL